MATPTAPAAKTVHLNPCPDMPGHFRFLDAESNPIDTASGPRESMIRIYIASGYDVRDESGRAASVESRLADLRRGWKLWCHNFTDDDLTGDEADGYRLAEDANNSGGERPCASECRDLDGDDLR